MAKIEEDVRAVVVQYAEKFPVPQRLRDDETDVQIEARCRDWTTNCARQVAFSFPGRGYGCKRADGGRPLSKDMLAQRKPSGQLVGWDLITGAGTGRGTFVGAGSDETDLAGQTFVPVEPFDFLGGGTVVVPPTPSTPNNTPTQSSEFELQVSRSLDVLHEERRTQEAWRLKVDENLALMEDMIAKQSQTITAMKNSIDQAVTAAQSAPVSNSGSILDQIFKRLGQR